MNAAGVLALFEVVEIVAAHRDSTDMASNGIPVWQGLLIAVSTCGALFLIKRSIERVALAVANRQQVGPSGASPDVVDLLVEGVAEGAHQMVEGSEASSEEVMELEDDINFVPTAAMPLAFGLQPGYTFVWAPYAAGPVLIPTAREDCCPSDEIDVHAALISLDLVRFLLHEEVA